MNALAEALSPHPVRRLLSIMLAAALLFVGLVFAINQKPAEGHNTGSFHLFHCPQDGPPMCPDPTPNPTPTPIPTSTPSPTTTPTPTPNPTPCSGLFLHEHDGSCHGTLRTCNGVKDAAHHETCPTASTVECPNQPPERHTHSADDKDCHLKSDLSSPLHSASCPEHYDHEHDGYDGCHYSYNQHGKYYPNKPGLTCDNNPGIDHSEATIPHMHPPSDWAPHDMDDPPDNIPNVCVVVEVHCPSPYSHHLEEHGDPCPNPTPTPVPTSTSNPVRSVPSSPTGLTVSCVGTTGTVSWNTVSGASSYRAVEFGAGPASRTISRPSTSFTYTGKTGVTDRWRVRAQNSNGNSAWSSYRSATCSAALSPPSTPSFTSTTCVNTGGNRPLLSVEWGAVAQASSYRLERDTGTVLHNGTGLSWSRNNPAWGSVHTVKIRAENSAGNWAWSSWVTVTCPSSSSQVLTVPSVPANVAASCVGTTVTVSWDSVSGAASYFAQEFGSGPADRTVSHPTTQFTDTGTAGFSYSWRVRAQNSLSNSAWSAYETVTCPAQQVVPTGVSAVCANNIVTVSWNAVSGAAIYRVREENGNAQFDWGSGRVNPLPTSTTFTRTAGETTKWQVRAHHGGQWRPWSSYASVTCGPAVPATPSFVTTTCTNQGGALPQVFMSWTSVSGATGYRLERSTTAVLHDGSGTSETRSDSWGVSYQIKVRAYNVSGNSAGLLMRR